VKTLPPTTPRSQPQAQANGEQRGKARLHDLATLGSEIVQVFANDLFGELRHNFPHNALNNFSRQFQ
jgi:hypothetical protein